MALLKEATTPHLAGELFKLTFGLDLLTVPFNGAGPAVQSLVGGHTPIGFLALPPVASNIKSGNLRCLVVLAKQRSETIPDVPTMAESGIPDQESDALTGVVGRPARRRRSSTGYSARSPRGLRSPRCESGSTRSASSRSPIRRRNMPPNQGRDPALGQGHQGREHPHRLKHTWGPPMTTLLRIAVTHGRPAGHRHRIRSALSQPPGQADRVQVSQVDPAKDKGVVTGAKKTKQEFFDDC